MVSNDSKAVQSLGTSDRGRRSFPCSYTGPETCRFFNDFFLLVEPKNLEAVLYCSNPVEKLIMTDGRAPDTILLDDSNRVEHTLSPNFIRLSILYLEIEIGGRFWIRMHTD